MPEMASIAIDAYHYMKSQSETETAPECEWMRTAIDSVEYDWLTWT